MCAFPPLQEIKKQTQKSKQSRSTKQTKKFVFLDTGLKQKLELLKKTRMKKGKEKTLPPVSILIPIYNGSLYLGETIASIKKNSYPNYEIILVDDGSTDESKKLCAAFVKKDPRIKFYSFAKNQGMTRVLNFGIRKAKGKYIARLNQDDLIAANRLEKQVKFLEANPKYVAIGGQIVLFTEDNPRFAAVNFPLTDKEIRKKWLILSPFSDPTVMYRKKAVLETNGYSQFFWPADDIHMWYQLGKLGKLANLPDVLTKVRWHKDCGSIKKHRQQMQKTWAVHLWATENVERPSLSIRVFWLSQYLAGFLFPPTFNWFVYRQLKKFQSFNLGQILDKARGAAAKVKAVITQPKIANLSGV